MATQRVAYRATTPMKMRSALRARHRIRHLRAALVVFTLDVAAFAVGDDQNDVALRASFRGRLRGARRPRACRTSWNS